MKPFLRTDGEAVTPVVAEILLVAIAVVLAAVIYIMASGLLQAPGANKPYVTFAAPVRIAAGTTGLANYSIQVADVSASVAYGSYKVNLAVEDTIYSAAVPVAASGQPASLVANGTAYRIVWNDAGGDGMLNAGDTFVVSGNGVPLPANVHFRFYLIWVADGSAIQTASFLT